jgi:type II secretory pathway pseudopilin PulG
VARLRRQRGFTYLGLLILVAIIGLVGAAAVKVDTLLQRAQAERELLEVGAAFSEALRSYAAATPRGQPTQPPGLQELLKDPRVPGVLRHLRKVFVDPVTGKAEWGIVYAGEQRGVLAVYSLSAAHPLKRGNFDLRFQGFEDKQHISDWKFTANGVGLLGRVEVAADGRREPPQAPGFPPSKDPASNDPPSKDPASNDPPSNDPPAVRTPAQEAASAPQEAAPASADGS